MCDYFYIKLDQAIPQCSGSRGGGVVQRDELHQSLSVSVSRAGKGGNSSLGKLNI